VLDHARDDSKARRVPSRSPTEFHGKESTKRNKQTEPDGRRFTLWRDRGFESHHQRVSADPTRKTYQSFSLFLSFILSQANMM
jgi:hypothetical protein